MAKSDWMMIDLDWSCQSERSVLSSVPGYLVMTSSPNKLKQIIIVQGNPGLGEKERSDWLDRVTWCGWRAVIGGG